MAKRWPGVLLAGVCSLIFSVPSFAHHSQSWADYEHPITLVGTVVDFQLINPHSEIWIDVKKDDGSTQKWLIEMGPVSGLHRDGWDTNTIKLGDAVKITAGASKDGRKIVNGSLSQRSDYEFLINGKPAPNKINGAYGYGTDKQ